VLDYVTAVPPVPVVVCDGSGRAADLLAFVHQFASATVLPDGVRPQLQRIVEQVFAYATDTADQLIDEILLCVQQRNLV
jgi:transient receptor potential cation channel subfamily M protein 3